ncbi:MAG: BON domain-containing protein [Tatlockia sp.]|nr:BON domain-containing protein [Tatlockia sp.]
MFYFIRRLKFSSSAKNCWYRKQLYLLVLSCGLLTGCISNLLTGANLIYDRHNVYKKISDFQLAANASRALYHDKVFKDPNCSIDLAVFNGDILLAGHLPTHELRQEANKRILALPGFRRLFNQLELASKPANTVEDSWITAKIRSGIIADSDIDPHAFKVTTVDRIVYLMGDVRPQQAAKVIELARKSEGVERVVKLFKYYNLSSKASADQ